MCCEDDIQAGNETGCINVNLHVACLKRSLQVEQDSLRTDPISVRLVERARRIAY